MSRAAKGDDASLPGNNTASLSQLLALLQELDALKQVERRTYVHGGERRENAAEHSWHVALAAWALAGFLGWELSVGRLLRLALVHDLGELDAGDTFLYAKERDAAAAAERAGVERLAGLARTTIPDLLRLWDEQEQGETAEARVLKIADRLLPLLHNLASHGKTWREHGITHNQVLARHAFIGDEAPVLYAWIQAQLDEAVAQGWLTRD